MKNAIIIEETITVGEEVLTDVDPMILASMRERLNPPKPFSYANNDYVKESEENEKKMREKVFVKMNMKTKKFSGSEFFSGKQVFKDLAKIPYNKEDVIIYTGKGNNVHPSLWKQEWFE